MSGFGGPIMFTICWWCWGNRAPTVAGAGSAIFLHLARGGLADGRLCGRAMGGDDRPFRSPIAGQRY